MHWQMCQKQIGQVKRVEESINDLCFETNQIRSHWTRLK